MSWWTRVLHVPNPSRTAFMRMKDSIGTSMTIHQEGECNAFLKQSKTDTPKMLRGHHQHPLQDPSEHGATSDRNPIRTRVLVRISLIDVLWQTFSDFKRGAIEYLVNFSPISENLPLDMTKSITLSYSLFSRFLVSGHMVLIDN